MDSISAGFVSLGCAKNLVDSQIMAGVLISEGISLAPSPEEADVVIVNTCSFIEEAREESIESILSVCELKQTGSCKAVLVTGCLPQRYKRALKDDLPEVDAFVGLDGLEKIGEIARAAVEGKSGIVEVSDESNRLFEPEYPEIVFTGAPYAYLKIAEGCNHMCAFCAIPGIRGSYRSREIASIVSEAERLLAAGYRELDIISQDVTWYGLDADPRTSLACLLKELGRIGGKFWARLLYGYPSHVTTELLETMAEIDQVCPYLDLPIQHSHPDILKAMRRAETVDDVANLGEKIRGIVPDAVLRTTCLVGFPGETDEHFQHLLEYVKHVEFDHLGVFVYSPEEGTAAEAMKDRPDREIAQERRDELLLAQRDIVDKKAAALIGTETEVLLENQLADSDNEWIGRSIRQAPEVDGETLVTGVPEGTVAGTFTKISYTAQNEYDMEGKWLSVIG